MATPALLYGRESWVTTIDKNEIPAAGHSVAS
jgi:hypothetical protein